VATVYNVANDDDAYEESEDASVTDDDNDDVRVDACIEGHMVKWWKVTPCLVHSLQTVVRLAYCDKSVTSINK
jgi:hypothetical protein